jgi:hypothetical protein
MICEDELLPAPVPAKPKRVSMAQRTKLKTLSSCIPFLPLTDLLNLREVHQKLKSYIDHTEMFTRLTFDQKKVKDFESIPPVNVFEDYFRISKNLITLKDDNYRLYRELVLKPMINIRNPELT